MKFSKSLGVGALGEMVSEDLIDMIGAAIGKDLNKEMKKAQALSVELKLLVESGKLQTYTFNELYGVLANPALVAMPVSRPALHIRMMENELVDNHEEIIPAFRQIMLDNFVLLKDYEYFKSQENKQGVNATIVDVKEALNAVADGRKVRVKFTASEGELVSLVLNRESTSKLGIPMEALLNGIFYILD